MSQPTLDNCDTEPIHIPGSIQNHGFHIATDQAFTVRYCSENIAQFTDIDAEQILGKELHEIAQFGDDVHEQLKGIVGILATQDQNNRHSFQLSFKGKPFHVIANLHNGFYTLDFEPADCGLSNDIQSLIGRSLSEILSDSNLQRLLTNAATQVKKIIGYDRIMVYKFHDDGHGEVVAEAMNDGLESWMGLHYPASDIPKQARELYKLNLVRLIADVNSTPSALVTHPVDGKAVPLDLTHSTLRAVSPIHIQYLKNMGVASSFSVSILDHEKLWGLIACHNYTPKFINYNERESAKLVGQVLSSAISFREQEEDHQHATEHRQAVETITRYLLRNIPVESALLNPECDLKEVLNCSGACIYYENQLHVTGKVPEISFIHELIAWLGDKTRDTGYFSSQKLVAEFEPAGEFKETASGVLACRLGKDLNEYIIWFRPEVKSEVKWAGNPEKTRQADANGILHISPRNSFNEWVEQVEFTAQQWKKHELDAALLLRDEVNYAISRKATELRVINEKLRAAYAELDAFSYTISHDLKNPLSTIRSYAQLIQRGQAEISKIISMGERIEKGTQKMQMMIDEVLAYSKAGQERIQVQAINMQKLLEELRHDLLISANNPHLEIEIKETPEIYGDELMVMQVFSNLLGNAVKYSKQSIPSVVSIAGSATEDEIIYSIKDNGIGIPPQQHDKIFELFSRVVDGNGFEGTGVGLAIVKRILEKHNGRIWLESQPGKGSVFFVGFKHYGSMPQLN